MIFLLKQPFVMHYFFIFIIPTYTMLAESINYRPITRKEAVAGIINGMIGSIALLLPVDALNSGYIETVIAIVSATLFCSISSWIYSLHMGDQPDIGYAINDHFKVRLWGKLAYDFFVWIFILLLCVEYFQIIVKIWESVIFDAEPDNYLVVSSVVNGLAMLIFVLLLQKLQFGAKTMVYGIFSIVVYCVFLAVKLFQEDTSVIPFKQYNPFGDFSSFFSLMATMTQGCMIQGFLIPFLKKLKNQKAERPNFFKYTFISYGIGGFVYIYIALVGSFGIVHKNQNTNTMALGILEYFPQTWDIKAISIICIIHISSVYPQYIIITRTIFLENLQKLSLYQKYQLHNKKKCLENSYIVVMVVVCATIAAIFDSTKSLAVINGGIVGGIITFAIPCVLHLYCMLCMPQQRRDPQLSQNEKKLTQNFLSESTHSQGIMEQRYVECKCDHYQSSKKCKVVMTIALVIWTGIGLYISAYSLIKQFNL